MASLLTPSNVKTARRNCISAVSASTILEKVLVRSATRIVKNNVLPRKANETIRAGPKIVWNWTDSSMPVPSRPNQIQRSHFVMVYHFGSVSIWSFETSHCKARKKPATHQTARNISIKKSFIMAWSEMKTMLSGIRLKATRVSRIGAARQSTGWATPAPPLIPKEAS